MPRRVLQGVIVSDKGNKTVVVNVERTFLHPVMKKTIRQSKKYHAHDEGNAYKAGRDNDAKQLAALQQLSSQTGAVTSAIVKADSVDNVDATVAALMAYSRIKSQPMIQAKISPSASQKRFSGFGVAARTGAGPGGPMWAGLLPRVVPMHQRPRRGPGR